MAIAQERLTLEQFLNVPEQEPALEYAAGRVSQKVSPKARHSRLQAEFVERINGFARPTKLAEAFPELRTTFGGHSYVPDVAVYRWDRVPVDEAGVLSDDFFEPPDIAVEVASPEQSITGLIRRCLWYVENGVQLALLADPADESVLVFQPGKPVAALHGDDAIALSSVLPGFRLTVQELFMALRRH